MRPGIGGIARHLYLALFGLFLAAPPIVVIGVSLNDTRRMSFPPEVPGLHWYQVFFTDPHWLSAFATSLGIAAAASALAMTMALPLGYAVWKFNSGLSRALATAALLPFMLPGVVIAVVYLVFWSWTGHGGKVEDTVVSHAMFFLAVPVVTVNLGFRLVDRALIEAAETMGARDGDVFRSVVLPLLLPYIVSGLLFVFVLSLNDYLIAYMVAGFNVETLPIKVFNSLRLGFEPTMCVGAALFMLVGATAFTLVALFGDLPKLLGAEGRSR